MHHINEIEEAINEFEKIMPKDCKIRRSKNKKTKFGVLLYAQIQLKGLKSTLHYEFRFSDKDGLFVEFHIENRQYSYIGRTLEKITKDYPEILGHVLQYSPSFPKEKNDPSGKKNLPSLRIKIGSGEHKGHDAALVMKTLIDSTRSEIMNSLRNGAEEDTKVIIVRNTNRPNYTIIEKGNKIESEDEKPDEDIESLIKEQERLQSQNDLDPTNIADARTRVAASIVQRQGQPAFRAALLKIFNNKCAISSCDAKEALEAAHIFPFRGPQTNGPENGLLLRADLHTLFDLNLISVNPETDLVCLSPRLTGTRYMGFDGYKITLPEDDASKQRKKLLLEHFQVLKK
jgi:hypothetical protein